ncbi:MarR family winged helix-turn-helix transcriptional regulator [Microbacterium sp. 1P10AE]|uniref:MarR family winged helix-turn-helix transcriptional regulator n=1 Tax=Microbacterium sp. 1P10AE TaxID=3132286 RepID=UPI00399FF978
MNTSTPLDPRSLAHRLTTVGHALHHRLFAQLRDGDLHPKTVLVLRAIDGRIDAPWITERLARGGKRLTGLADRGWIERTDDGWALTTEGRAVLDRVDADRATILADVPAEELERLVAALDTVSAALGIDETEHQGFGPGMRGSGRGARGFGPGFGPGAGFGPFGRGFGPGAGFGPFGPGVRGGFGPDAHGFGPSGRGQHDTDAERHGGHGEHEGHGHHTHGDADRQGAHEGRGHGRGCDPRRGGHGHHRGHDDRRAVQRAYERGFDAGFSRGRESSASGEPTASE